jgi:hypothetical protein
MPAIIDYTLATILFAICIGAVIHSIRIVRAIRCQQHISDDIGGSCCSIDTVGCSIVCSQIKEIADITTLLSTEYDHYEVIIVLDTNLYAENIEQIIHHFKLIQVNAPSHTELPNTHIRKLYRSSQRCFRRLILIEQGYISPYDDINAATALSSYDYIIPLIAPNMLRAEALDYIFITLARHSNCRIDILRSTLDAGLVIQRDVIVAAGGFSPCLHLKTNHGGQLSICLPLLSPAISNFNIALYYIVWSAIIIICYLLCSPITAIAALLTAILITISTLYAALLSENTYPHRTILYHLIDIRRIFYRRKFIVS